MYENQMFKTGLGDKGIKETLDRLSAEGWETVGMHVTGVTMFILAKRPRQTAGQQQPHEPLLRRA
jgi:hypothetical protein